MKLLPSSFSIPNLSISSLLRTFFSILFFASGSVLYAQTYSLSEFSLDSVSLKTDVFGNVYIHSAKQLVRYTSQGEKVYSYQSNINGTISSIDCSDPFKTIVFFQESNQIVFLDTQGAQLNESIGLEAMGIYGAESVCAGHGGNVWLFNAELQVIQQISQSSALLYETTNLEKFLTISDNTKYMQLIERHLCVYDRGEHAIWVFSAEGSFVKNIHLNEKDRFLNFSERGAVLCQSGTVSVFYFLDSVSKEHDLSITCDAILFCSPKFCLKSKTGEIEKVLLRKH